MAMGIGFGGMAKVSVAFEDTTGFLPVVRAKVGDRT
jgi:hypothetical protein